MTTTPAARLVVVTASADATRVEDFEYCLRVNAASPQQPPPVVAVVQKMRDRVRVYSGMVDHHQDYLGVVPAFARGVALALQAYPQAEVIACLHDDCLVQEPGWDQTVLEHFDRHPACGLAGFGGAWGLGDEQAGQGEYRPTWLVRRGFMSNMRDAEVHGTRVTVPRRIAVLDGFSLIFRRQFLQGDMHEQKRATCRHGELAGYTINLFALLQSWGVVHHAYDAAMGAFARQLGWDTGLLPLACQHLGGQTAVGDSQYAEWAKRQRPGQFVPEKEPELMTAGDQAFWEEAHRIIWAKLGHLLPFAVDQP